MLPTNQMTAADKQTVVKEEAVDFNKKSPIEANFKPLKKYEDSRFGQVTIIEVPGNPKKLMVREKTFNSQKELEVEIRAAMRRISIGDRHLLALTDYSTGSRSDFCSSVYWIKLFFEFPDHDIDQELRRRNAECIVGFTSTELTHMLYQTIHAGSVLNKAGLYHGDICPQTVEMDNPEFYKLVERFGELAHPEEFQQTRLMSGGEVYSAPEIYSRIRQGRGKTQLKGSLPAKAMMTADIFNLGMTILHAGTDEGVQKAYNDKGNIDVENLEKLKRDFSAKFPDNTLLVTTVYAMLELDPARRPADFITMEQEMPPYSVIIQALEAEKQRKAGPQQNNYNNYVSHAAWEQNWSQAGQAMYKPTLPAGPLGSHLPQYHQQPPQTQPNVLSNPLQPRPPQQAGGFPIQTSTGQTLTTSHQQQSVHYQQPVQSNVSTVQRPFTNVVNGHQAKPFSYSTSGLVHSTAPIQQATGGAPMQRPLQASSVTHGTVGNNSQALPTRAAK